MASTLSRCIACPRCQGAREISANKASLAYSSSSSSSSSSASLPSTSTSSAAASLAGLLQRKRIATRTNRLRCAVSARQASRPLKRGGAGSRRGSGAGEGKKGQDGGRGGGRGGGSKRAGRGQRETSNKNAPKRWFDLVSRPENERFDEALVSLEAGRGGRGEIWKKRGKKGGGPKGRLVDNFKYKPGGQQPKKVFLQADAPADGSPGGHVFIEADETVDDLLHLHERYHHKAKDGGNANHSSATAGAGKKKRNGGRGGQQSTPPLVIKVPVGTTVVVKSKRGKGGASRAEPAPGPVDLMYSGQRILIARGGKGGHGVREEAGIYSDGVSATANTLDWQKEATGEEGETTNVQIVLRVKADIGLVGLPNAGKSTLLSAITKAKPEIADYPFTTLVPNLGVIGGRQKKAAAAPAAVVQKKDDFDDAWENDSNAYDDFSDFEDEEEANFSSSSSSSFEYVENPLESLVVADLPGLIGDAHRGKGLGRVFLRHLKRTRLTCHLVDLASSSDPFSDYIQIREELRMYNPDYVTKKPHVVVFTKCDLLDKEEENGEEGKKKSHLLKKENFLSQLQSYSETYSPLPLPLDVVYISSLTGEGMEELVKALAEGLETLDF